MKKTYITTMPDHIGAFLEAGRCFAALGMNITRVSYNKAVDINTLFIDAEGTAEQHEKASSELEAIGYLQAQQERSVILLEFRLEDVPGTVERVLELINEYRFNISYISSQENGTEYQLFKMGLFVENLEQIEAFLQAASALCSVRVIDYNHSEKIYDNSIFYNSFAAELARDMDLPESSRRALLVDANLAMQVLDERGLSPYRTFDSISAALRDCSRKAAGRTIFRGLPVRHSASGPICCSSSRHAAAIRPFCSPERRRSSSIPGMPATGRSSLRCSAACCLILIPCGSRCWSPMRMWTTAGS